MRARWSGERFIDLRALRRAEAALLFRLLLVADAIVILLHLSYTGFGIPGDDTFDLGVDRSYGEMLGYLKLGAIAILTTMLARRRRAPLFGAIALTCLTVLLEDALILHERLGLALAAPVGTAVPALADVGILAVQVGELVWLGGIGVILVVILVVAWVRADPHDRRDAAGILLFLAVLGVLTIGVDTVHSVFEYGSLGDQVFTVIEDGGELMALTPAFAVAFGLVTRQDAAVGAVSARAPRPAVSPR